MKLTWLHTIIQLAWSPWLIWGYEYYHIKSMQIFTAPDITRTDSYFGYSVTYDESKKRLIASAPRADNIGRIYSCDIDQKTPCTAVPVKPNITRDYDDYTHDYWLGATVAGGPSFFVTCAPRNVKESREYSSPGEFAQCYRSTNKNSLTLLTPVSSKLKTPFDGIEKEMDSFGWSVFVSNKDSILIGGPAMRSGLAVFYKTTSTSPKVIKSDGTYNFGYSVAIGQFTIKNNIQYAIGSTYGNHGEGWVKIYTKEVKRSTYFQLNNKEDVNSVGTMFGAVLCVAKVSRRMDDLIVGAPAYATTKEYNVGAIYIYVLYMKNLKLQRKITGKQPGSFFGNAVASVGDLNGDHHDEIAVSAPYEDNGRGVVYLYCGAKIMSKEREIMWLQKIQPEEFGPLSTFGLSLSYLKDYDDNGCNELAIGAPGVDKVALLRCIATVTIKVYAIFPNLQIRKNLEKKGTFTNFESCIDVIYPQKPKQVKAKINVTVKITHSSAKLAMGSEVSYTVTLDDKKSKYCNKIGLELPKNGNKNKKIEYNISASLLNNPVDSSKFEAEKVIFSDRSSPSTWGYVSAAECENESACEPKLNLNFHYGDSNDFSYVIGTSDDERLSISVINEGEAAYSSCVQLNTSGVPIRRLPETPETKCKRVETDIIKCEPKVVLRNGNIWNILDIELDTKSLTSVDKELLVRAQLFDNCNDFNKYKDYNITFDLKSDSSGIIVLGSTQNYVNDIVNLTTAEISNSTRIEHKYNFRNNGPTNWEQVKVDVQLKQSPFINFTPDTISVHDGQCSVEPDYEDNWHAVCTLDKIFKDVENVIFIYIDLKNTDELVSNLENKNVTIQTNVTVYLNEREIRRSIVSTLVLEKPKKPIWIIIVAILLGLLLILLIVLILTRLGCLRRKKRRDLRKLRESVRRQTIRRSMMHEDRQRVLSQAFEVTEETDENAPEGGAANTSMESEKDRQRNLETKIMQEICTKNKKNDDIK